MMGGRAEGSTSPTAGHLFLPDADVVVRVEKKAPYRRHSFTEWCRNKFSTKPPIRRGSLLLVKPGRGCQARQAKRIQDTVDIQQNSAKDKCDWRLQKKYLPASVSTECPVAVYSRHFEEFSFGDEFSFDHRYGSLRLNQPLHSTPVRRYGESLSLLHWNCNCVLLCLSCHHSGGVVTRFLVMRRFEFRNTNTVVYLLCVSLRYDSHSVSFEVPQDMQRK